jgi:glycosyltransferase involved in cell wall biosynthesis
LSSQDDSTAFYTPLVSVSMTAFNSERWLARALDSVLLQRTDFPIEIVLGDDYSTDGTLAIARSYQKQSPHLIRVLERNANIGMQRNFYDTFDQCRGRYIAWLDADDYWTDPDKLSLQVQALESDLSVSACGHYVRWVSHDGEIKQKSRPALPAGRYGLKDILRRNFLPSPSIMFRNGLHRDLPDWFFDLVGLADWPILVMAGLSGDIVLLDRVMADYMLTPGSAYMSKSLLYQDAIDVEFYEHVVSLLPSELRRVTRAAKGARYESMAYTHRKQGDFAASRRAALMALRTPALMDNLGSKSKALLVAVLSEVGSKLRRRQAAD